MIEAEYSSSGLDQAIELLKKIHKETGAKNQAAKITGEKLNSKGVFAIADKLTGKDLIIEQAGAMEESTLQELNQLMARDETGMNVVLIDVAGNLARIHRVYPGLAKRFEYVGKMGPEEVAYVAPEGDDRPVRLCSSGRQKSRLCPGRSRAGKKNQLLVRLSRYRNQLPPGACQNQSQSRGRTRIVKQKQSRNQIRCAGKWKRAARSRLPQGRT